MDGTCEAFPRGLTLLTLETRRSTAAYWIAVAAISASLFIPSLLPLVDYPQHIGMAEMMHRMADPQSSLHAKFSINYFTYNALFHFLVAQLAAVMPAELAGRLVTAAALVGLAGGTVALLRTVGRPPFHAALFVPLVFSSAVGWGFINYALSVAIGVAALVFVARTLLDPSWRWPLASALLSLLCGFTHVLGTGLLAVLALAFAPELAWRATATITSPWRRLAVGFQRSAIALAPIAVGGLYCVAVYLEQHAGNPAAYRDPRFEGYGEPPWTRLGVFAAHATGLHGDYTDQLLVYASLGIAFAVVVVAIRGRERRAPWPLVLPFAASLGIFCFIPLVFIGTFVIYPRFGQTVVFGLLFALPALRPSFDRTMRRLALVVALATGGNLVFHMVEFAREADALSRVIDAIPPGRRVAPVIYDHDTRAFRLAALVHVQAYYGARRRGEWAYNFASYESLPLKFRAGSDEPEQPDGNWGWAPTVYNPHCAYARFFDVALVRAPAELAAPGSHDEVRALIFGREAADAQLVAEEGRYYVFDTDGLSWDGTP
jgi:hypothetical protein